MTTPQSGTRNDRQAASGRQPDDAASAVAQTPAAAVEEPAGGAPGPVLSTLASLDATFEVVDALLTVQRRFVDRLLMSQHRIAAQLVYSAWALTTAIRGARRRGRSSDAEDA